MARGDERSHPTLHSVARAAGVSIQSVSNAFNAPHKLSPATLARIEAEVGRQGYRPNRSARSLRSRRSGLVGLCVPRAAAASGVVGDRFVHAVTEAAERAGYHVLLFTSSATPATPATSAMGAYEALIAQRAVDGFVLADTTAGDARQGWLAERHVAFAAFGRRWADPEIGSWVDIDGAAGMAAVVRHLAGQGHRRLAFIGWPAGSGVGDDRFAGFERAARAGGLAVVAVERGSNDAATGARLTHHVLHLADPPTAVVCVSDDLAIGADAATRAAGLVPGRDLAITGFDDSPAAAVPALSLTSVRQPLGVAGEHVVRLLAAHLADRSGRAERVLLEPTLVVRASSSRSHPPTDPDTR